MATETAAEKKEREAAEAAAAKAQQADAEAKEEEPRYEVDYLVRSATNLLDSRPTLVAAALSQSDRKTHTLEQAQELLDKLDKVRTSPYDGVAEPPDEEEAA